MGETTGGVSSTTGVSRRAESAAEAISGVIIESEELSKTLDKFTDGGSRAEVKVVDGIVVEETRLSNGGGPGTAVIVVGVVIKFNEGSNMVCKSTVAAEVLEDVLGTWGRRMGSSSPGRFCTDEAADDDEGDEDNEDEADASPTLLFSLSSLMSIKSRIFALFRGVGRISTSSSLSSGFGPLS